MAGSAVVDDRTAHALDRLLRAVPPALLALSITERIVIRDLPDCGLRAVALPVASLAFAHGIPAVFMLPMIVAAAQREVLLDPDNLSAQRQPASSEVIRYVYSNNMLDTEVSNLIAFRSDLDLANPTTLLSRRDGMGQRRGDGTIVAGK